MNVAIKYKPHRYIKPFHDDRMKYFIRAIVTGYGGGKTYAGCMELLACSGINQGVPNVYIEPTYQMIKDILEPELISILDNNSIPYQHNKSEHNFFLPMWDGHIWLRSGDRPEKLKGINAGVVGIDEPFIQDVEIFKIAISRARHPNAKIKGIFLTGTPEELNWGYELLITKIKDNTKMYHGTTIDNIEYLGSEYIEQMREHYTDKEIQAYIDGKFVNLSYGNCYYSFSDENIIDAFQYMYNRPLEISCDFNVDLMCWNISQELNDKDFTFDYVEIEGEANTYKMCDKLKEKYPNHTGGFIFYGDATGKSRDPSSALSSWAIIQECFPTANIFYQPIRNIRDRINATNARMKNSKGEIKYYVTKNCERLIKDFRQVTWELLQNKQKAGLLTHTSDGYSYQAFWKYPQYGKTISKGGYQL